MADAGFPEERIAEARARAAQKAEFEVWPENWPAVDLFRRLATQWRVGPMGQLIGLNYPGIESTMNLRAIPRARRRKLFAAIQIMEAAALDYLKEKAG